MYLLIYTIYYELWCLFWANLEKNVIYYDRTLYIIQVVPIHYIKGNKIKKKLLIILSLFQGNMELKFYEDI